MNIGKQNGSDILVVTNSSIPIEMPHADVFQSIAMLLAALVGAAFIVVGSAIGILRLRRKPFHFQNQVKD